MSEHWENFPSSMGEYIAFISYDHGVRNDLKELPFPYFLGMKIALLASDDSGLPHGDEFFKLNEVEDLLCARLASGDGIPVGRITTNGRRYFHFYTSLSSDECHAISKEAGSLHGHQVSVLHEFDAERSHYWEELFPTADDWQVIKDMRVEDALTRKGDLLTQPRVIEHWAYFESEGDRRAFAAQVRDSFENIQLYEKANDGRKQYVARLNHTGLPDYRSMNQKTILLSRAAREHGGHYDGWESEVCGT